VNDLKVLFVPHCPAGSQGWEGSRPYHLCRQLGRLCDLHVVTWHQSLRSIKGASLGAYQTESMPGETRYKMWLLPNLYRLITRGYPRTPHLVLNQLLLRRTLRRLIRDVQPDVLLYAGSHHFTGFPPLRRLPLPVVFDYVDKSPAWVESKYIRHSDAVVTVSDDLAKAVAPFGKPASVIPNGVELERYASVSRAQAKEKLGLSGSTVISLIGLTCDPSLYFVDAVKQVLARVPNAKLLIVGSGDVQESILRRCREIGLSDIVCAPGAVPNGDVHWHFAATDVGLYPGADIPYFREASPLKIVEYAAAGAQVVSSPVIMFERGWPNVRIAPPTPDGFARAILEALESPQPAPSLERLDWEHLARQFEHVLRNAVEARQSTPLAASSQVVPV